MRVASRRAQRPGLVPWMASLALVFVGLSPHLALAAPSVEQCLDASERGQTARDTGALARSRELFTMCASPSCPAPVRSSCAKWLESVVEGMPSIVVVVRDDRGLVFRFDNVVAQTF